MNVLILFVSLVLIAKSEVVITIFKKLETDFFRKRTLKVKPETPLLHVFATLATLGVLIEGRYTIAFDSTGTTITYLATELQQKIINYLLDHMDEYAKPE